MCLNVSIVCRWFNPKCIYYMQMIKPKREPKLPKFLKNGYRTEDRYKFPCSECNKRYTTKGHLKQHMQLHTGRYSFYCQICKKGFNSGAHYRGHLSKHEGVKYQCQYCSKIYSSQPSYKQHLLTHRDW